MSEYMPLDGDETLLYDGVEYEPDRVYHHSGMRNAPVRVWSADDSEIHYRPQTMEMKVVHLSGESHFAEPVERDDGMLVLESTY